MKVNIKKLQQGGFATATPVSITWSPPSMGGTSGGSRSAAATAADQGTDLNKESYKKLLSEGGLDNDVYAFMETLQTNQTPLPFMNQNTQNEFIKNFGRINEIVNNKKEWERAIQTSKEAGGLGEVAVGNNGELYVKNQEGSLGIISMSQFSKDRDKYRPLTVSEVLSERAKNPNLVFNTSIFSVAENSIGTDKILDNARALISALGSDSETTETYLSSDQVKKEYARLQGANPTKEQYAELQSLNTIINSPTDVKETILRESKEGRFDKALSYIWNTMGTNAQNKLTAVAITNGVNNPKAFLADMLTTESSRKSSTTYSQVNDPERNAATQAGAQKPLGLFEAINNDYLKAPNTTFSINNPKFKSMFAGVIGGVGKMVLPDDSIIPMTTISNILKTAYGSILDPDQVFLGDVKVESGNTKNIMYSGEDFAKVYLPVKNDEVTPDIDSIGEFKILNNLFEINKNKWTVQEAKQHFSDKGFDVEIEERPDGHGKTIKVIKDSRHVKAFAAIPAYTNSATDLNKGNDWLVKLSQKEENLIEPELRTAWTVPAPKGRTKDLTPGGVTSDYFKGMVFIPYRNDASFRVSALVKHGPTIPQVSLGTVQNNIQGGPTITNGSSIALVNN